MKTMGEPPMGQTSGGKEGKNLAVKLKGKGGKSFRKIKGVNVRLPENTIPQRDRKTQ